MASLAKRIRLLEEENRGLKKRFKALSRAAENNFVGLHYWKAKAKALEQGINAFSEWVNTNKF